MTIIEEIPLVGAFAQQGITITESYAYCTQNTIEDGGRVSKIFLLKRSNFVLIRSKTFNSESLRVWNDVERYIPHIGQIALNPADGWLYATFMDLATRKRTALLKIHPETLEIAQTIDLTLYSPYIDGIAFDDNGRIWLPYGNVLSSFRWKGFIQELDGSKTLATNWEAGWERRYYDNSQFSTPQGIQVRNDAVYFVPENDVVDQRTRPENNGIVVFFLSEMIVSAPANRVINTNGILFHFQLPQPGMADHEAFAFDPDDQNVVYISTATGNGDKLYKLRFETLLLTKAQKNPGAVRISFPTVPGGLYEIQSKSRIEEEWTELSNILLVGQSANLCFLHYWDGRTRFYRIIQNDRRRSEVSEISLEINFTNRTIQMIR